jgi:catechol 2,3-dioxygenase-like lactoylglutathione lyase family enzyme
MGFGKTTPILRIFDEAKAKEFYVEFLGFRVDWEHRFRRGPTLIHANFKGRLHPPSIRTSRRL